MLKSEEQRSDIFWDATRAHFGFCWVTIGTNSQMKVDSWPPWWTTLKIKVKVEAKPVSCEVPSAFWQRNNNCTNIQFPTCSRSTHCELTAGAGLTFSILSSHSLFWASSAMKAWCLSHFLWSFWVSSLLLSLAISIFSHTQSPSWRKRETNREDASRRGWWFNASRCSEKTQMQHKKSTLAQTHLHEEIKHNDSWNQPKSPLTVSLLPAVLKKTQCVWNKQTSGKTPKRKCEAARNAGKYKVKHAGMNISWSTAATCEQTHVYQQARPLDLTLCAH